VQVFGFRQALTPIGYSVFKERCRSLRFVSVAALSAEEANYTALTYPRQHFVRRNLHDFQNKYKSLILNK
jgi:hypothetical protein